MCKKLFIFILILTANLSCFSQGFFCASPTLNGKIDFGEQSTTYGLSVNFQYYREIGEITWTRLSCGIGFSVVNDDFGPIISLGYGVGINFGDFYGLLDFSPTINCVGTGAQVYGDEISLGIMPKIGFGHNWNFTETTTLFTEIGFYREFTLIYTRDNVKSNSYGFYLNIGIKLKYI